jgi:hypothetical protein
VDTLLYFPNRFSRKVYLENRRHPATHKVIPTFGYLYGSGWVYFTDLWRFV